MSKEDMNPVMYGMFKMVEYKVQVITFSQIFHHFYTYLANCVRYPNPLPDPLMVKDTNVIHIALLKTTSLCTFVAKKSKIHRGSIFTLSDNLPTVKSNTVFGEITLMALEKYSLKTEENLVYLCFGLA